MANEKNDPAETGRSGTGATMGGYGNASDPDAGVDTRAAEETSTGGGGYGGGGGTGAAAGRTSSGVTRGGRDAGAVGGPAGGASGSSTPGPDEEPNGTSEREDLDDSGKGMPERGA